MSKRSYHLTGPLLLSLLIGCGTWVGNAVDQSGETNKGGGNTPSMRVEVKSKASDGTMNARHTGKDGQLAGTVQLTEVVLMVERVRFTKGGIEVATSTWTEARPIHLGTEAVQIGNDLGVAPDTFDEVWLETTNGAGAVSVKGNFVLDNTTVPLDLSFSQKLAVNVAITDDPVPTGTNQATLTVTLNLDGWFNFQDQAFDLRELTSPITMASHLDLEKIMRGNLERSGSGIEAPRAPPPSPPAPETPAPPKDDDDDDDDK